MPKSKKRSGTASSKQPEALRYFVDHNLGREVVPRALSAAGYAVEVHTDHFKQQAADIDWIPNVAVRGWVILTKDRKILKRPHERAAVLRTGARYVAVSCKRFTGEQIAALVVSKLDRIDAIVRAAPTPVLLRLLPSGLFVYVGGDWLLARGYHENPKWWRKQSR